MIRLTDKNGRSIGADANDPIWAPFAETEAFVQSAPVEVLIVNDEDREAECRVFVLWRSFVKDEGWTGPWVKEASFRERGRETARPTANPMLVAQLCDPAFILWYHGDLDVTVPPRSTVSIAFAVSFNETTPGGELAPFRVGVQLLNPIVPLEEDPVALDPHAVPAAPIAASVTVGDEVTAEAAANFVMCPTCGSYKVSTSRSSVGIRSVVADPNRITAIVCGICGFEVREDDKGRLTVRRRGQA